jgi:hypothetical protein
LGRTEDDVDVKKAVNKAQVYYNAQEKREWAEWAGKILMPRLHAQMAMEQADAMRAEQEELEEMRRQDEVEQRERERAEKEEEWEKREVEFIRQVDAKEIDDERFRELVNELDLERVMAESVAEGPATTQATTQDEEAGESEREESAEEEPAAAEKVVESSTVGKGKRKAAPARAKVYAPMDEPVSSVTCGRVSALTYLLTVRPILHTEDDTEVHHDPARTALQEVPDR